MRLILLIIAVAVILFIIWDHKSKTNNKNRYVNTRKQKRSGLAQYHKNLSLDEDDNYTIADIERDIENDIKTYSHSSKQTINNVLSENNDLNSFSQKNNNKHDESQSDDSDEQIFERDWDSVITANKVQQKTPSSSYDEVNSVDFDAEFATAVSSGFENPNDIKINTQKNSNSKPKISADSLSRSLGINIDPKQLEQLYKTNQKVSDKIPDDLFDNEFASQRPLNKSIPSQRSHNDLASDLKSELKADYDVRNKQSDKTMPQTSKVYTVYVKAKNNNMLKGEDLLQALLSLGCRYGDMNIFHRYEQSNGQGRVMFSVASMVKPGTLNIDKMQELSIPGIVLFFTYPGTYEPLAVYDLMMKTSYQLAKLLDADVLDENKEPMTSEKSREIRAKIEVLEIQEFF